MLEGVVICEDIRKHHGHVDCTSHGHILFVVDLQLLFSILLKIKPAVSSEVAMPTNDISNIQSP
jgi:hypothetical protein